MHETLHPLKQEGREEEKEEGRDREEEGRRKRQEEKGRKDRREEGREGWREGGKDLLRDSLSPCVRTVVTAVSCVQVEVHGMKLPCVTQAPVIYQQCSVFQPHICLALTVGRCWL